MKKIILLLVLVSQSLYAGIFVETVGAEISGQYSKVKVNGNTAQIEDHNDHSIVIVCSDTDSQKSTMSLTLQSFNKKNREILFENSVCKSLIEKISNFPETKENYAPLSLGLKIDISNPKKLTLKEIQFNGNL